MSGQLTVNALAGWLRLADIIGYDDPGADRGGWALTSSVRVRA